MCSFMFREYQTMDKVQSPVIVGHIFVLYREIDHSVKFCTRSIYYYMKYHHAQLSGITAVSISEVRTQYKLAVLMLGDINI
jgi:hypothetical protein